ncbi:MAG: hemerythrin domain-containing protein [Polyangiaceae bacterium]
MLLTLKKRAAPAVEPGVFDLLMECHARIRRFTSMAEWLSHATTTAQDPDHGSPDDAIRDTAAMVVRYFTVALPSHSADEDRSIAPRLLSRALPGDVAEGLARMAEQHVAIEALVHELVPSWRAIAEDSGALPDQAASMSGRVERLRGLWDVHLHIEESSVFPFARACLPAAEQQEILTEMRARRK